MCTDITAAIKIIRSGIIMHIYASLFHILKNNYQTRMFAVM